ncbi:MAG: MarC family protein [Deltaproteobacteria bacterium]|nr:MarC family protein [Deltaproteobacteria bacterium]
MMIDPVGIAPLFFGLSSHIPKDKLRHCALKGTFIAYCTMLFFGLFGHLILAELGVSIPAFKIAGGALLFVVSFNMIMNDPIPPHDSKLEAKIEYDRDWAVSPLAIPLLAGPGSITTTMLLMTQNGESYLAKSATIVALTLTCIITYFCLAGAERLTNYMGKTGANVFARVLGIILAALAVQYMADGIRVIFKLG